ncbi:CLUMA_CG000108, isoform A [Clunio marinus]|uniref:CLUMA_CG000108, isoform A n=1 Tax=Clunio marinus TaxID=568069 RepID=A0A1J1HEE1_9DIPT|nr:CLUMA_CG000108, isoform A [Clunio marinus]
MPILMVAQQQINSLNFSDSDLSEEPQPLDFTMSKFKSSAPSKHPLYHQFFGSTNNDTSLNRDQKDEKGKGLSDNEMMAWRQLHLTTQQHEQILTIPRTSTSTPQMSSQIDNGSSLFSLRDVMLKHQQRFEKRRLSENDLDRDIKHPKLSPIENNTCTSTALPLSLTGISLLSGMRPQIGSTTANEKTFRAFMNHRDKAQNQQYIDRLRRMNERSHCKERGSRVNFDQHNSAKTVREELANRKQQAKNGKVF